MSRALLLSVCFVVFSSLACVASNSSGNADSGQDVASRPGAIENGTGQKSSSSFTQIGQSKSDKLLSNRLLLAGTLIGILLGQLSVLFGYLKIDHATRGFYSGRLQSIAAVVSIVIFAAGYLFYTNWIL